MNYVGNKRLNLPKRSVSHQALAAKQKVKVVWKKKKT